MARCGCSKGELGRAGTTGLGAVALAGVLALSGTANASPPERERGLVIGAAAHLAGSPGDSCTQDGDQVGCSAMTPFAGADLTAQYWLVELLAIGARAAVSKDLDASEGDSSEGIRWDPEDQWLWRLAAEARLDPPLLPRGLWAGAQVGLALLRESSEELDGGRIREDADSRAAPLFGLALGWDFWLGRSVTIAPELRAELISFGDAPELRPGVTGHDYESSLWLDLALRLSYVF